MMNITASMVKDLREKTGAGMMDCKRALQETEGDFDKAIDHLREKGIAKAASKVGRVTSEGAVVTAISADGKSCAIIEMSCETDFVARTDDFKTFCKTIAEQVVNSKSPASIDDFKSQRFSDDTSLTIAEAVQGLVGKLGENMSLRRVEKIENVSGVTSYIHPGDKLGVIVAFDGVNDCGSVVFKDVARDVAMHVAATGPQAINRDEIDSTLIDKEREIFRQQALNDGKPEKIIDKIINGKIDKFYSEITLTEQAFVKDPDTTVGELLKSKAGEIGDGLAVSRFVRYRLGE
ncbi:elongation factor Ts [Gemmatimonas aurantiaca]|nr:elongation factor Ts [Gemmatimonas aurantiaca]